MTETFGQKRSTVHQVAALGICAVLLGGSGAVQAGGAGQAGGPSHTFTIVVDSERDGLAATRCPAINTFGNGRGDGVDTAGPHQDHHQAERTDTPVTSPTLSRRGLPDHLRQRVQQPPLRSLHQR